MPLKISQNRPLQSNPASQFNVDGAVAYNTKSEALYKQYETDVKRILGTSADWKSPEFAQAVYNWQQRNGLSGKWVDGKLGPITLGKMAQVDQTLAGAYDPYTPYKRAHDPNEKLSKRVIGLIPEVERIRQEMAPDIPLQILIGWIAVESNGKLSSKGLAELDERGLFQSSRAESAAIGADHDKIAQDQDYSIRKGIELAKYHSVEVDKTLARHPTLQQYFPRNSEMYWKLAFFSFSAGQGTLEKLLGRMAASGSRFDNWNDVMRFAAFNAHGYSHSPTKWAYHTNRAWTLGSQAMPQMPPVVSALVAKRIKHAKRIARQLIIKKLDN